MPNALICLADGSEETEVVTTADLLVRGGIRPTLASVESDGRRDITCSRGIRLLADARLVDVADDDWDAVILPGGMPGAQTLSDSPLLVETVRQCHLAGKLVAAICAAPAAVLVRHQLFPSANMTGFPGTKAQFPAEQWQDKRVVYDARFRLLTSQAPGTTIDFALKIIDLLCGRAKAAEVAAQLVTAAGIYQYQE